MTWPLTETPHYSDSQCNFACTQNLITIVVKWHITWLQLSGLMAKHKETVLSLETQFFESELLLWWGMLICCFARWRSFSMEKSWIGSICHVRDWGEKCDFCPKVLIFLPHDLDNWCSKSTKHLKPNASIPWCPLSGSLYNRHRILLPLKSWMGGLHMCDYAVGPMMTWKQLIPTGKS